MTESTWTPKQLGTLLGLSEATVKRLLGKAEIPSGKPDGRNWRTPARLVPELLRAGRPPMSSLREAALAGNDEEALALTIERWLENEPLGSIFDDLVQLEVPLGFIGRARPLAEANAVRRSRGNAIVLEAQSNAGRMADCLFRANAVEVLQPAAADEERCVQLVKQSRAHWFWLGPRAEPTRAIFAAAERSGCTVLRFPEVTFENLQQLLTKAR